MILFEICLKIGALQLLSRFWKSKRLTPIFLPEFRIFSRFCTEIQLSVNYLSNQWKIYILTQLIFHRNPVKLELKVDSLKIISGSFFQMEKGACLFFNLWFYFARKIFSYRKYLINITKFIFLNTSFSNMFPILQILFKWIARTWWVVR